MKRVSSVKKMAALVALLGLAATACTAAESGPPRPAALVAQALPPPASGPAVVDDVAPKREPLPPARRPAPPVDPNTLQVGAQGAEVAELESRLDSLRYMTGALDARFDRATFHAVMAFQKVEGLPRTGKADSTTRSRLQTASTPAPAYATPLEHIEVDIRRQVVLVVTGGAVSAVLPTSTGSGKMFRSQGWSRRAVTPNGQFQITRKINGMRISPLGKLYKPAYFNGGIALHGNPAVPAYPASHGCVRLPMQFADWFFNEAAPIGRVVYVYGGPSGPNPQPVIDDRPDGAEAAVAAQPAALPPPVLPILPVAGPPPSPATTMPAPLPQPSPTGAGATGPPAAPAAPAQSVPQEAVTAQPSPDPVATSGG